MYKQSGYQVSIPYPMPDLLVIFYRYRLGWERHVHRGNIFTSIFNYCTTLIKIIIKIIIISQNMRKFFRQNNFLFYHCWQPRFGFRAKIEVYYPLQRGIGVYYPLQWGIGVYYPLQQEIGVYYPLQRGIGVFTRGSGEWEFITRCNDKLTGHMVQI